MQNAKLSVIIPAYNEEESIEQILNELKQELDKLNLEYEIIVVNDASTDRTKEILEKIEGIKTINHSYNKGYGASLKTGIEKANFNNLLFFDADGQHKVEYISELLKHVDDYDLITGARTGYRGPFVRQPGKRVLKWLANYLSQQKIPDINCGLRIVKREQISKFTHLLCDGLSFSTTTLLTFIGEHLSVKYVPITINRRAGGKSAVKPRHALDTLILILRTILFTSPLRVFLPITLLLFMGALISGIYDIFFRPLNITDITILLTISSVLMFFFGLLADQIAAIRKEINK